MKLFKRRTAYGQGLIGAIITGLIGTVSTVVAISIIVDLDTSEMPTWASSMLEIIPIVFAVTVVLGTFAYISGDEETVVVGPIKKYVRIKRWDQFGTRLKVAYKAKFGYSNPAFSQRVDELILSMRATSNKSLTYKQNEDALKRLSRFVEVKFVVPEEGKWSEVKRTKQLDRELHEKYNVPLPKILERKYTGTHG